MAISLRNRVSALENKTVLPGPPPPAPKNALGILATAISIVALIVPFAIQALDEEKDLNAEQRAALGPVLNDVSIAERNLWNAKMELIENNTDVSRDEVADLQDAYLDATYQVLPHAGLDELRTMNRVTQVVLANGYNPEDSSSKVGISAEVQEEHDKRVAAFQSVFRCSVSVEDQSECEEQ